MPPTSQIEGPINLWKIELPFGPHSRTYALVKCQFTKERKIIWGESISLEPVQQSYTEEMYLDKNESWLEPSSTNFKIDSRLDSIISSFIDSAYQEFGDEAYSKIYQIYAESSWEWADKDSYSLMSNRFTITMSNHHKIFFEGNNPNPLFYFNYGKVKIFLKSDFEELLTSDMENIPNIVFSGDKDEMAQKCEGVRFSNDSIISTNQWLFRWPILGYDAFMERPGHKRDWKIKLSKEKWIDFPKTHKIETKESLFSNDISIEYELDKVHIQK